MPLHLCRLFLLNRTQQIAINMLWQGILLGLTFSVITGPLMFSIIQASLARGFRAGFCVAAGIWVSDLFFILLVWQGLTAVQAVIAWPGFRFWAGLAGGLLLIGFGLNSLRKARNPAAPALAEQVLDVLDGPEPPGAPPNWTHWGYAGYWLRGFIINTVNPFTVFFWLGIATGVVLPNEWSGRDILLFFGGMMGVLVLMDTLKAYAAKRLRRFLTPKHTRWVQRGIGVALMAFGVALIFRAL